MKLREALNSKYENNDFLVNDIILEMRERVLSGEDPEEVLYDEGLEPDYVMDLLDECDNTY